MASGFREFQASVRRQDGTAIVELSGVMDGSAEQLLNSAYAEATSSPPERLLLNFADVDYINSTGIALIVGLLARSRAAHRPIAATGLSDHYREIFTITRLSDFMEIA